MLRFTCISSPTLSPTSPALGPACDEQQQQQQPSRQDSGDAASPMDISRNPSYLSLDSASMSRSPSAGSSLSSSPTGRPGLSRANSINFSGAETSDDSFTGLTLLDALVVIDSHLDLASRNLRRKTTEWKSRAESTAIQVKRQAEEVLNQQRRRRRRLAGSAGTGDEGSASVRSSAVRRGDGRDRKISGTGSLSDEELIDLDRELLKFREKVTSV